MRIWAAKYPLTQIRLRSADFQVCRIADFQVGRARRCVDDEARCIRRFGNLRYGRLGNLRYARWSRDTSPDLRPRPLRLVVPTQTDQTLKAWSGGDRSCLWGVHPIGERMRHA